MHLVTSYAGKEHITAADQGAFNAALIGTGQFVLDKGNGLEAQVITNNQVRILDGELMMQGRFVRLEPGTYVDLTVDSGTQGYYRNDLIVARYTKDAVTGVEGCDLVVIKGTAVTGSPSDPEYTAADITNGASVLNDFPLWRIPISGINVGTPESMFGDRFIDSMRTLPEIRASVNRIHSEVDAQLARQDEDIQKQIDKLVSYTKEETLSDETKAFLNLDANAVPDDAFKRIAPVGAVFWYTAATAPNGYLICDGAAVLKADYPKLYAVLGSTFGEETDTEFYLPNLSAAFIRGAGTQNGYSAVFGETQEATAHKAVGSYKNVDKNESETSQEAWGSGSYHYPSFKYFRPFNVALTPIIKY